MRDEEHVVEALDSMSDYEYGLERMGSKEKGIAQNLQNLVRPGRKSDAPLKKRKCRTIFMSRACSMTILSLHNSL